jgi:hypothetical protein
VDGRSEIKGYNDDHSGPNIICKVSGEAPVDAQIEICRKEIEQRILVAKSQGGWEGTHTDFKRELGSKPRDSAKLIKHILAFSNTPRRTDACIIFGVNEDKHRRIFEHVGTSEKGFPEQETIEQLVHHYTRLKDVVIDSHFILDGKRTPYVLIPLQYDGPHSVVQILNPGPGAIYPRDIFCRYGSRSERASDRDQLKMQTQWETWFLDCRYEKNATSLSAVLEKHFPKRRHLQDIGPCIRLVYDSIISNEFGTHEFPVLVHAYWGLESVEPAAVDRILNDKAFATFSRTIIGGRFSTRTLEAATAALVQCVPLDEIYFVADPYAKLCREFRKQWNDERSTRHLSFIVDLDFRPTVRGGQGPTRHSILTFLEEQVNQKGRSAVVVHGDFGCGKTTTAKRLVSDLYDEYLRGNTQAPKVLYLNVNGMDIRAKREECIESELRHYHLPADCITNLLGQVENDEIGLIFDGVDEMAKPYTVAGRKETRELLRGVTNRRTAVYLVRSSYFAELDEMIGNFSVLANHDFHKGEKRTVIAEILGLRQEQVVDYLDSRLGPEDAQIIRSTLHKIGLESFLRDPLIVSLVTDLIEEEGIESLQEFPQQRRKADFLGYLVDKLLDREQNKRQRHGGLAADFELFQRVLRAVAFSMVCQGLSYISPNQLESFVFRALERLPSRSEEDVDAFRTMAWIHRSEDGALAFRHEALTLVCAAQHICAMFEVRDALALSEWQSAAPLADIVCDYAGKTIRCSAVLGAMAMLGEGVQFNIRLLIKSVLEHAKGRDDFSPKSTDELDERTIAAICRGISTEVDTALLPIRLLLKSVTGKRALQVTIVLLWLLSRSESEHVVPAALELLHPIIKRDWNLCDELRSVKEDPGNWFDAMLLRDLKISTGDLMDTTNYESLFTRVHADPKVDTPTKQYSDRTVRAIEGARKSRIAAHRKEGKKSRFGNS